MAQIRWAVEDTLPEVLSNLATVVGTLAVLFWMSWPLALAACATCRPSCCPARRVGRWRRKLSEQTQEQHAQMLALLSDVLNVGGYVLMRLFNRTDQEARRFAERNAELLRLRLKLVMVGQWMTMFVTLFGAVGPAVVYWYGGMLVIQGN